MAAAKRVADKKKSLNFKPNPSERQQDFGEFENPRDQRFGGMKPFEHHHLPDEVVDKLMKGHEGPGQDFDPPGHNVFVKPPANNYD